jgi:hypothetical protein
VIDPVSEILLLVSGRRGPITVARTKKGQAIQVDHLQALLLDACLEPGPLLLAKVRRVDMGPLAHNLDPPEAQPGDLGHSLEDRVFLEGVAAVSQDQGTLPIVSPRKGITTYYGVVLLIHRRVYYPWMHSFTVWWHVDGVGRRKVRY